MEVKGTVKELLSLESGISKSGKDWSKRTLVIDTGDQYNPLLAIDFNKPELLNGLKQGQEVTISVNLSSREAAGRYYTSVTGWKIS